MYLDANLFAFAYLIDQEGEKARDILDQIVHGRKAITSSLALDEVMWVLMKNKKKDNLRRVIEGIYATPNIEIKEVGALIPLHAVTIMEHYHLKPRDAIHVAIMEQNNVKEIVSDDADFDKVPWVKRIRI